MLLAASSAGAQPMAEPRPGDVSLAVFGIAGQGFNQELARGQGFSEFGGAAVVGSRLVSRRLELQLELHPVTLIRQPVGAAHGPRETVAAFAADIGLRWFPGPRGGFAPFVEILDGPYYALRRTPARGTRFNFLTQAGFGARLPSRDRWRPEIFGRWFHISNANTGARNPDWDYWAIGIGGRFALPAGR